MTDDDPHAWAERNRRHLRDAIEQLRERLATHAAGDRSEPRATAEPASEGIPALDALGAVFGLSAFERELLLLVAAVELDGSFGAACARAHGDPARPYATFGLALAALADPHWSALAPDAPLRRWRLVEVEPAPSLTRARVRVNERTLHALAGIDAPDARLSGLVAESSPDRGPLPESQARVVASLARLWEGRARGARLGLELIGPDLDAARAIAAAFAAEIGSERLLELSLAVLPGPGAELEDLLARLEREHLLTGAVVVIDAGGATDVELREDARAAALERIVARPDLPVVVVGTARRARPAWVTTFEVPRMRLAERAEAWLAVLGEDARDEAARLAAQFVLPPSAMAAAAREAELSGEDDALWHACRRRSRVDLGGLARRIEPARGWDEIVLPEAEAATLRQIAEQARHRAVVQEAWGFGGGCRGAGITALFAGPSGTGKTLAAEVIAGALGLDLCHVDLSQVVNKYIGETEKNLARIFDAAEQAGAVLLFDEADALFGKRTEVRDSHDRYANIEVSYLLQRMEAYRGVAVLTTNLRENVDPAFVRRLRFIVTFPFPDAAQRAEIWRRVFPPAVRTRELDLERLAVLDVAGGTIRNIALHAAYRAAANGGTVTMADLREGALLEYAKLERALPPAEVKGW